MNEHELKLGTAYVFRWMGCELTGVLVRHKGEWCMLATTGTSFTVPETDVVREVEERRG